MNTQRVSALQEEIKRHQEDAERQAEEREMRKTHVAAMWKVEVAERKARFREEKKKRSADQSLVELGKVREAMFSGRRLHGESARVFAPRDITNRVEVCLLKYSGPRPLRTRNLVLRSMHFGARFTPQPVGQTAQTEELHQGTQELIKHIAEALKDAEAECSWDLSVGFGFCLVGFSHRAVPSGTTVPFDDLLVDVKNGNAAFFFVHDTPAPLLRSLRLAGAARQEQFDENTAPETEVEVVLFCVERQVPLTVTFVLSWAHGDTSGGTPPFELQFKSATMGAFTMAWHIHTFPTDCVPRSAATMRHIPTLHAISAAAETHVASRSAGRGEDAPGIAVAAEAARCALTAELSRGETTRWLYRRWVAPTPQAQPTKTATAVEDAMQAALRSMEAEATVVPPAVASPSTTAAPAEAVEAAVETPAAATEAEPADAGEDEGEAAAAAKKRVRVKEVEDYGREEGNGVVDQSDSDEGEGNAPGQLPGQPIPALDSVFTAAVMTNREFPLMRVSLKRVTRRDRLDQDVTLVYTRTTHLELPSATLELDELTGARTRVTNLPTGIARYSERRCAAIIRSAGWHESMVNLRPLGDVIMAHIDEAGRRMNGTRWSRAPRKNTAANPREDAESAAVNAEAAAALEHHVDPSQ
jgi:hypothetical protein